MVDGGRETSFAQEPLARSRIFERPAAHFERDAPAVLYLLGFIDDAHASSAERAEDAVRTENGPRRQQRKRADGRPVGHRAGQRHIRRHVRSVAAFV
jgi:hypothetical protein